MNEEASSRRVLLEVGGPPECVTVSLYIYGRDIDLGKLTACLGAAPDESAETGSRVKPSSRPLKRGFWALRREAIAPESPAVVLERLLDSLPQDRALWTDLSSRYEIRVGFGVFLESWNRGFDLSPALVQRVSALGASFGCDIYGPEGGPAFGE